MVVQSLSPRLTLDSKRDGTAYVNKSYGVGNGNQLWKFGY